MKPVLAYAVRRVGSYRWPCWRLAWAVALFAAATAAWPAAQLPEETKRVLIVLAATRIGPGFATVQQALVEALTKSPVPVDITVENLATERFPDERSQRIFNEYLLEKYGDHPPALIVLIFIGNLEVPVRALRKIFPDIPIVVTGQTDEPLRAEQLGTRVGGFVQRPRPAGTLELMLRLHPDLRRIVVIGGTSGADREVITRVQEAAQSFAGQVQIDYWTDLTYAQLQERIVAMPPNTAILYTRFFRDAVGRGYASGQVGQTIGRIANVPVYVLSDPSLGEGAVGGLVVNVGKSALAVATVARTLLEGASPESLPFEIWTDTIPTFDARALKRWGIDERLLPPESVVRYRPVSIWQQYREYVITGLLLIVVQSALLFALVVQRARTRRARAEVSQSQQMIELAASAGGLGLWARDTLTDELWINDVMRSLFRLGPGAIEFKEILARIHPEDRGRVIADRDRAQQAGQAFEGEYRVVLPDGAQRWHLAKGHSIKRAGSGSARRLGVVLDITERKLAEERLRESEENFRRLVESTSVVIWQADPRTWLFTYVGPQAVELLGYPIEQWYEKDFWTAHIHPEDREWVVRTCSTLSRQKQEFQFDYRMVSADGGVVWIHDIVNCEHENGEPVQLRGLMFDITERKFAEQALRESEARFRTVANAAPVMICMSDADNVCVFCNSGWVRFAGRTIEHERVYGRKELFHPEDAERCLENFLRAFELRREFRMEYRMQRNDGEYRFVLAHGVPRFSSDGGFLGYIETCIDVTERRSAEQSLESQRKFLRQVIDINPNLIFAKDREGRFTLANQALADTYGVTVGELIGRTDADINPNVEEVASSRKTDLEVMDTLCERFIPEERLTDRCGEVHWMQTVKRPIAAGDGERHQVLGTSTDITQRKRAEVELHEQRAQITHVARVSIMGELAASLAHELNQPLAAILSNAQAALRFMDRQIADPQEIREILQDIVTSNRRAGDVIRHVRALVKKGEADLEFVGIDLAELMRDVLALVHSDAVAHNVRISVDVPDDLPTVRGDRVHLQQIVLNIVLNAFDAMSDRPRREREVTLRAVRQSDRIIRVSISDRGSGLPEGALDKIFQPFYTTKAEGLGMGLSICRSIMELHGGTLSAANNADGGATFSFTLPVHETWRASSE